VLSGWSVEEVSSIITLPAAGAVIPWYRYQRAVPYHQYQYSTVCSPLLFIVFESNRDSIIIVVSGGIFVATAMPQRYMGVDKNVLGN
jgi:hypothetical protein